MSKQPIIRGMPTPSDKEIKSWNKALKDLKNKRAELKKELSKSNKNESKLLKLRREEMTLRLKVARLPPILFHYADKRNMSEPVE